MLKALYVVLVLTPGAVAHWLLLGQIPTPKSAAIADADLHARGLQCTSRGVSKQMEIVSNQVR